MQASDDFNAHFPMGRLGSEMYKTPPGFRAEQDSAAQSLGSWGRASQGWVCTHVPLCTRTENTFSW